MGVSPARREEEGRRRGGGGEARREGSRVFAWGEERGGAVEETGGTLFQLVTRGIGSGFFVRVRIHLPANWWVVPAS